MQMDILQVADGTPIVTHDLNLERTHGVHIQVKAVSAQGADIFESTHSVILAASWIHTYTLRM